MPPHCCAWDQLFFTQRGSYSVERLFAFNDYCSRTPQWRTIAVCFLFSVPPLVVSIGLELIPLQDPHEGARANYGAWIRQTLISFICSTAAIVQMNQLVPRLALSVTQILVPSTATACCYILVMFTIADNWIYPVPFGLVLGTIPCAVFLVFFFLVAVGFRRFRSDTILRQQLYKQFGTINAAALISIVYPVFSAIYYHVPVHSKPFFVVLLPVIKLFMQQFFAWFARDLVDHQPGIVVFLVKVFNSLYSAKSMQTAGESARFTTLVIVAFDLIDFALILRRLHRRMVKVDQWLEIIMRRRVFQSFTSSGGNHVLICIAMKLCKEPGVLSSVVYEGAPVIRLQSSVKHSLTIHRQRTIDRISRAEYERTSPGSRRTTIGRPTSLHLNQVAPIPDDALHSVAMNARLNVKSQTMSLREKHDFVHAVLKIHFDCEYNLLSVYVKCIVPVIYVIYMVIVFHLPSAKYYPELLNLTAGQNTSAVLNILVYAGLEFVTFSLLHTAIKWRCGFSPTYLLAFVLESQALEFQSRLLLWYVFLLELTLTHFGKKLHADLFSVVSLMCLLYFLGVDLSLQLTWMKTPAS